MDGHRYGSLTGCCDEDGEEIYGNINGGVPSWATEGQSASQEGLCSSESAPVLTWIQSVELSRHSPPRSKLECLKAGLLSCSLDLLFNPEDGGDILVLHVSWISTDYKALYSENRLLHNYHSENLALEIFSALHLNIVYYWYLC